MPVVYLIPGGGSNYLSWFEQGMGNNIFDNLTAAGKLKPSILVSMQREDINGDSGRSTDFNMYEGDANSASVTDLDAWMDHYGITHNANSNGNYDVTAGNHNWPIWMKLTIVYASDYLWKKHVRWNGGVHAQNEQKLRVFSVKNGIDNNPEIC